MGVDKFKHVQAGEPLIIPAPTWNALLDTANAERAGRLAAAKAGAGDRRGDFSWLGSLEVVVANGTGSALASRAVVVGDPASDTPPVISPVTQPVDAQSRTVLNAIAPTAETDQPLIVVDGTAVGGYCRAVIAGIAVCDIDIVDETHLFARCEPADVARLKSDTCGPARILWAEDGTGFKRAIVLLGVSCEGTTTTSPFVAEITAVGAGGDTGKYSWVERILDDGLADGTWEDGELNGAMNAFPTEIMGTVFPVAVGATVLIWASTAIPGSYEFLPIQYASETAPGLVSLEDQTFLGNKTFTVVNGEDGPNSIVISPSLSAGDPFIQFQDSFGGGTITFGSGIFTIDSDSVTTTGHLEVGGDFTVQGTVNPFDFDIDPGSPSAGKKWVLGRTSGATVGWVEVSE